MTKINREIKFRAWHKEKKRMIDASLAYWLRIGAETGIDPFDKCEWMQHTGLKDKNGKEIYEGDILRKYHCNIESLGELKTDGMQWWMEDKLSKSNWENMDITSGKFCEVIGNIYENPELII